MSSKHERVPSLAGLPGSITHGAPPFKENGLAVEAKGKDSVLKLNGSKTEDDSFNADGSKKISGAELKKLAKAEKQAKRAQAKSQPEPTTPDLRGSNHDKGKLGDTKLGSSGAAGPVPGKAALHRKAGSVSGTQPLPVRSAHDTIKKPPDTKKEDDKKVALFGHLYGHLRRTTIAGANKDVHPAVLALGLKISSYVVCGSTARCVGMLLAFKEVIKSYTTPPQNNLPRHLTSHLSPQIEYLVSCRPLATSMGNAIRWLKLEINDVDPDTPEKRAKAELCAAIDRFIQERITVAAQIIADRAQEKIQDGDVILTFAKSYVVQQTLVQALRKGKRFSVIVMDSRPLFEGKNLARSLADIGMSVQYSTMHAISHIIARATKVFLGAHSMVGNGRLYSRAGSAIVAMMAKSSDVPVIVCCESIKFTDRVALDSIVTNEVAPAEELLLQEDGRTALDGWRDQPNLQLLNLMYDVTPAEYINMVVTEHGSLPPSSVPVVHRLSTNT